ncbi:hypothetical protein RWA06_04785 [Sinorhizobium meliloti]|uniref:hypothetical protein n=1 Tax=Rhizobium meliloti TaxID=382 RepID=UPI00299DEB40|nr:hypothetical protein [Sinorhizobium meliloti]
MTEIPDDIMKAAQKAFDDAMVLTKQEDADRVIALALLAERQRASGRDEANKAFDAWWNSGGKDDPEKSFIAGYLAARAARETEREAME